MVVPAYLVVCLGFNVLCAQGMSLGAFVIRTADLLSLLQLPGLIISGSAFLLGVLRYQRSALWDVIAMLTIVASVLGIVVVIFAVVIPIPYPIHRVMEMLRSSPHYPRRQPPDFSYCIDHFTAFAFTALDSWFCLGWLVLLRVLGNGDRERPAT
jgi:hypothetical protein